MELPNEDDKAFDEKKMTWKEEWESYLEMIEENMGNTVQAQKIGLLGLLPMILMNLPKEFQRWKDCYCQEGMSIECRGPPGSRLYKPPRPYIIRPFSFSAAFDDIDYDADSDQDSDYLTEDDTEDEDNNTQTGSADCKTDRDTEDPDTDVEELHEALEGSVILEGMRHVQFDSSENQENKDKVVEMDCMSQE
jgi:hypothetical protein